MFLPNSSLSLSLSHVSFTPLEMGWEALKGLTHSLFPVVNFENLIHFQFLVLLSEIHTVGTEQRDPSCFQVCVSIIFSSLLFFSLSLFYVFLLILFGGFCSLFSCFLIYSIV